MEIKRGFASDNNAGVHPRVLKAIEAANVGHVVGYGDDPYTEQLREVFRREFGPDTTVYPVFNGTGANVLSLKALTQSFHSIICTEQAHLHVDECGAPEKFTGCKVIPVPTSDGKIRVEDISRHLHGFGFEHHSQPRVISITQVTELGTVYTPEEIREIAELAHRHGMYLHMDGARLANAAAALNCSFKEITTDAGVDVLSLGGTKNGLMNGEAVVFLKKGLDENFKYFRKQAMQLGSKMRFMSVQFLEWFEGELWRELALHANRMAGLLAERVAKLPRIRITRPVEANGVFAVVPPEIIEPLRESFFFYTWDEARHEVRWMCSWDTTEADVDAFVNRMRELL
ncbi:MAG: low specificity L-threonine aldolase [Calditrichia bacterium]